MIAIGRLLDMPHKRLAIIVQVNPARIVGFLPNLSEARPQSTAVKHWDREKTPDVMPAHHAMFFFLTPKLSIISGYMTMSER
jgi:hypothetical protein